MTSEPSRAHTNDSQSFTDRGQDTSAIDTKTSNDRQHANAKPNRDQQRQRPLGPNLQHWPHIRQLLTNGADGQREPNKDGRRSETSRRRFHNAQRTRNA